MKNRSKTQTCTIALPNGRDKNGSRTQHLSEAFDSSGSPQGFWYRDALLFIDICETAALEAQENRSIAGDRRQLSPK